MLRKIHSIPGLLATLLLIVVSLTGAILAFSPLLDRWQATVPAQGQISLADLSLRLAAHYPQIQQIDRKPSGAIVVTYIDGDNIGTDLVDPRTGQAIAPLHTSRFDHWIKNLHRSLLMENNGQAIVGILAGFLFMITVSGTWMLIKRMGGLKQLLRPIRGSTAQRLHLELSRFAILGLLLSSLSGIYLSSVAFGWIPDGMSSEPAYPAEVSGGKPSRPDTLPIFRATDLNDLREVVFPDAGDPSGTYQLSTSQGSGYVDQASGQYLSYLPYNTTRKIYEMIYRLHTGEGLWVLGLLLGMSALTVPLMSLAGVSIWWKRRQSIPRIKHNENPENADTVILVGSEGNTTWGFARTLHDALTRNGHRVHTAAMNNLRTTYPQAQRLLIMTSTYGDGGAPASAARFADQLQLFKALPHLQFAVLGFGDRQFENFCAYASSIEHMLTERGLGSLLPFTTIDRQSSSAYNEWGHKLGLVLGIQLELHHTTANSALVTLNLAERVDYAANDQAPTCVLRFNRPPTHPLKSILLRLVRDHGLPAFEAGDLVGILPPGGHYPRYYSLASSSRDGVLEICVKKHVQGRCSGYLHGLQIGDSVQLFIQRNPAFRAAPGKAPVILIGAGTGIGPLAGFIRHNRDRQPMHLYWGGRDPTSDFLYEPELKSYLQDHRLTRLQAAFSRTDKPCYVQDKILADGLEMRQLIATGATVLVCGGRDMARGVMTVLEEILRPLNLDVLTLKAQGRYVEDVY